MSIALDALMIAGHPFRKQTLRVICKSETLERKRRRGDAMRKNPKARFLPIVVLSAIMPAILLPALRTLQVPDYILGATTGIFIGLAIVGLVWMVKGNNNPHSIDS